MGFFCRYFAPHAGGEPGGGFRRPARFPLSLPVFVLPVGVELSVFLLHRDTLRTPCCASPLFSRVPVIALLTVKSGNARDCGVVGCGVHPWTTLRLRWHGVNAFPDTGVLRCPTPCGKGGRGRALAPRGGTPFSWVSLRASARLRARNPTGADDAGERKPNDTVNPACKKKDNAGAQRERPPAKDATRARFESGAACRAQGARATALRAGPPRSDKGRARTAQQRPAEAGRPVRTNEW